MVQELFNDPEVFKELKPEITGNKRKSENFKIAALAHIILPFHKILDNKQQEKREEKNRNYRSWNGPCYTDKVARMGIRVIDLLSREKLAKKIIKEMGRNEFQDII